MSITTNELQSNCFNSIEQQNYQIKSWLQEPNNIIVTDSTIDKFTCYKISYLVRLFNEDKATSIFFQCDSRGMVQTINPVIKISTSFGEYHVLVTDLKSALAQVPMWNFMTLNKTTERTGPLMSLGVAQGGSHLSATHCQQGTDQSIYRIITHYVDVPPRYIFQVTNDEEMVSAQLDIEHPYYDVIFVLITDEHLISEVIQISIKHLGTDFGTIQILYDHESPTKYGWDGRFRPTKVPIYREIKALLKEGYYAVLINQKDGTYQYDELNKLIGQCRQMPESCHFYYTLS